MNVMTQVAVDEEDRADAPYRLACSETRRGGRSVVEVGGRKIGGEHFALIAGLCAIEEREQTLAAAQTGQDAAIAGKRIGAAV